MNRFWIALALATSACVARTGFGISPAPVVATVPVTVSAGAPDGSEAPGGAEPQVAAPEASAAPVAPVAPAGAGHASGGAYAPGEDVHWFQADDFLVLASEHDAKRIFYVAKMTQSSAANTKGEAHFLLASGKDVWSAKYYRTRVATRADLRVGATGICFVFHFWDGEADPPKDKHQAREGAWMAAVITDTADIYKGRVTVSGTSCALGNVRIPIQ
jgi:hypothetical protein